MIPMDRPFASTEILAWENNDLAILNAIEVLKKRLAEAPEGVASDILDRCDPETHAGLIDWLGGQVAPKPRRLPRDWSPKRNRRTWILYKAADLTCPDTPPNR